MSNLMTLLCCPAGGLYALAGVTDENQNSRRYMDIGAEITNTCHESYDRTVTKLGPENFRFVTLPPGRSSLSLYHIMATSSLF